MKKLNLNVLKKLPKSQKIVFSTIAAVIFIDLLFCVFFLITKNHSNLKLQSVTSGSVKSLIALDDCGRKAFIKENENANFKFSQAQKDLFSAVYEENGTSALTIRVNICPTDSQKNRITTNDLLRFGFLYKQDFTSKNKFIKQKYPLNNRIEIQAKETGEEGYLDISFAIPRNDDYSKGIPEGFYIYSSQKCKIVSACVSPAYIGFDTSLDVPFYGFSYNGGKINYDNANFDFSGSQMVFPGENSKTVQLPQFVITFNDTPELKSTSNKTNKVEINIGGEKFFINNVNQAKQIIIPAGGLKNPFGRIEIIQNKEYVSSVLMKAVPNLETEKHPLIPIKTDPGLILNYRQNAWRDIDYEIFEWDRFPGIIFFDTRDYDVQSKFFTRLAFFVEKEGFKGRLLSNEELEGKHGYNAHDYSAESMAKFFNKATESNFKLNDEEILLKKILIKNNLLEESADGLVKANEGGLVSISRECPDWSRINLLAHEGWHTIFFRDSDFRNFVSAVYYTMDPQALAFLIDYFKSQPALGYDVNDEYLMHNEFMAYIMQQPLNGVAKYFVHLANRGTVMKYTKDLSAYIRNTNGISFEDAAIALNDYVFDKYGIVCGNIALVNR